MYYNSMNQILKKIILIWISVVVCLVWLWYYTANYKLVFVLAVMLFCIMTCIIIYIIRHYYHIVINVDGISLFKNKQHYYVSWQHIQKIIVANNKLDIYTDNGESILIDFVNVTHELKWKIQHFGNKYKFEVVNIKK